MKKNIKVIIGGLVLSLLIISSVIYAQTLRCDEFYGLTFSCMGTCNCTPDIGMKGGDMDEDCCFYCEKEGGIKECCGIGECVPEMPI